MSDTLILVGMARGTIVANTEKSSTAHGDYLLLKGCLTMPCFSLARQAHFHGPQSNLRARSAAQLEHDIGDMCLNRSLADNQRIRDSLI